MKWKGDDICKGVMAEVLLVHREQDGVRANDETDFIGSLSFSLNYFPDPPKNSTGIPDSITCTLIK